MRLFVEGVGLYGPGLPSWQAAGPILAGAVSYVPAPPVPPVTLLPPNERRRAAQIVRFALAAGTEAFAGAAATGREQAVTASVFTSSGGDGDTIHAIMNTLAGTAREVSPTRFHNSVHNAAAGYWSILSGVKAASTALCCHDDSFAAGLLEAAAQLAAGEPAVALIAYDVPYPSPLAEVRPIGAAFAAALILTLRPGRAGSLQLELRAERAPPTKMPQPALEALRAGTPAARSLPLLAALAGDAERQVRLGYLDDLTLALRVTPGGDGA